MDRSLVLLILGLGIFWVILDEFWGDKKLISKLVKGIIG